MQAFIKYLWAKSITGIQSHHLSFMPVLNEVIRGWLHFSWRSLLFLRLADEKLKHDIIQLLIIIHCITYFMTEALAFVLFKDYSLWPYARCSLHLIWIMICGNEYNFLIKQFFKIFIEISGNYSGRMWRNLQNYLSRYM